MEATATTATLDPAAIGTVPHISGIFNYLVPMPEKPWMYTYEPPPGKPQTNASYEGHTLSVQDIRPMALDLSLDREGVRFVMQPSQVRDFYDEDEVRRIYYPETERLVAQLSGGARVLVFDHTIRRRIPGVEDRAAGTPRQPVPRVHNDYTLRSGPQRVRDLLGDEAEQLLERRFAIMNVWRPIRGPVEDAPLAICDARSVATADLVATDLLYRDRTGEIYYLSFNPSHRWLYAPHMRAEEVFVFKVYDSAEDDRARFSPHSAFEDPTAQASPPPRHSIELRTLVFF